MNLRRRRSRLPGVQQCPDAPSGIYGSCCDHEIPGRFSDYSATMRLRRSPRNRKKSKVEVKEESEVESLPSSAESSDEDFVADSAYESSDDDTELVADTVSNDEKMDIVDEIDDPNKSFQFSSDSDFEISRPVQHARRSSTVSVSNSSSIICDENSKVESQSAEQDQKDDNAEGDGKKKKRKARKPKVKKKSAKEISEENLLQWHEELNIDWEDLAQQARDRNDRLKPENQPESLINVKLLPFQKEGLAWLKDQEESKYLGGILADSMGMGKTIQTISLLLDKKLESPTLVICPVVALYQWKDEIEKYTHPGAVKIYIFHGAQKCNKKEELLEYDVVLSTYAIMESCFRKQTTGFTRKGSKVRETSIIHQIKWGRIVLDEAHSIKDRSCSTARAAFALKAEKRLCLTGTPLQNRVGELFSLIRFLKLDPFAAYYCKKCPCKTEKWSFSDYSHCDHCGHKPMQHFCWWNKEILKPIQKFGPQGEGKVAFWKLGIMLDQIMLRRTKEERAEDLGLPPRVVEIRRDFLNELEEDFYISLFSESRTKFASYVRQGTVLNNYAHIFELLSKLRQAADHPFLVVHKKASEENPGTYVCGICHEVAEDPIASRCKHVFCREDMRQYLESYLADESAAECPVCFTKLNINLDQQELPQPDFGTLKQNTHSSIVNRMLNSHESEGIRWASSTKIEMLLEELQKLKQEDSTTKCIIFSQFVSFLDIIYWVLCKHGYNCVKLDGRMGPQQRDSVIKSFMSIPQITVFLVSLKAGGVALNLTEASRIFILDPWWNPAVEDQAMDRIHRLGQKRPVKITRLVVENSIESRIVQLQEKKHLLFQSTVGKDQSALDRLTEEDLYFLFQM